MLRKGRLAVEPRVFLFFLFDTWALKHPGTLTLFTDPSDRINDTVFVSLPSFEVADPVASSELGSLKTTLKSLP